MSVSRDSPEAEREHYLAEADQLSKHIVARRQRILGRWHPYTLYGQAQRGRILAARWREDPAQLAEAAKLMSKTLEVARRDLGDGHLGVLAGKKWYAEVLMLQGRLNEAETYLREASNKELYAKASDIDGEHPDRIMHVWELDQCLECKGDYEEALGLCRELEINILHVGGHGLGPNHRFNARLVQKIEALKLRLGI
jgi:tetratricopeptide (TPR) repeat protein